LSAETIKNIEHGIYTPQESTISAIVNACAEHEVEFTENNGVQMAKSVVQTYVGTDGFRRFVDDFYNAVMSGDMEVCINGVNEKHFVAQLGDYAAVHFDRMDKIKGLNFRAIAREGDKFLPSDYIHYRWLPGVMYETMPFCVYANNLAVIIFTEQKDAKVVVIRSKLVSQAYREQFRILWEASIEASKK